MADTEAGKHTLFWVHAWKWSLLVPCPVWLPWVVPLVLHGLMVVGYVSPQGGIQGPPFMEVLELPPFALVVVLEPFLGFSGPLPWGITPGSHVVSPAGPTRWESWLPGHPNHGSHTWPASTPSWPSNLFGNCSLLAWLGWWLHLAWKFLVVWLALVACWNGLDADAAASDVAGMAPPGIAFAGLAQLPLAPTFGAFALAVVPMDLAFAAPAVGMVLLDASAPWSAGTSWPGLG